MPLFVGGIRDGDWLAVPDDRDQWNVHERLRLFAPLWPPPEDPNIIGPTYIRQMAYQRMKFKGQKETHFIFAAPGLTPDAVLEKLIRGYRPPESDDGLRG